LSFRTRMEDTSRLKASSIVLALDFPFQNPETREELFERALSTLEIVSQYVCAVKINHHLVLPLGTFDGVRELVKSIHEEGLIAIMDCKLNDIGATNQVTAEYYYSAGLDALIANPFVGWEEGLKPVFEVARNLNRGVILLTYMSHKGANEGYGQIIYDTQTGLKTPQYISFAKKAIEWDADGAVVGATYPEKIKEIYDLLREKVPIYSPGVGAQGGAAEKALKAGARYLIIGREITQSQNPARTANELKDATNQVEKS